MKYKPQEQKYFEKLYLDLKDDIYKVALYFTRNPQASEEITQVAFFQLYTHLDRVRPETARAYTIRATKNLAYNWQKYGFRDLFFESDFILGYEINEDRSAEEYCFERNQREQGLELSKDILTALRETNRLWYQAIIVAYVFEMSQEEAAKHLGIDKSTLQSRLYRARKWVRERYRDRFDEIYKPV